MANAKCTVAGYDWMSNTLNQDPCNVAGEAMQPCYKSVYNVHPLVDDSSYAPGNLSDPNVQPTACSCSWAAYNLFQACTICQSSDGINHIKFYAEWAAECNNNSTSLVNDSTWYPTTSYPLAPGLAIPQWAAADPRKWTNARFNATDAKKVDDANYPDLTTSNQTPVALSDGHSKKSTPISAIVGGTIGGLALLSALGFLLWYMRYRSRKTPRRDTGISIPLHQHRPSDSLSKTPPGETEYFTGTPGHLGMTLRTLGRDRGTVRIAATAPSHVRSISNESGMIVSPSSSPAPMSSHYRGQSDDSTPRRVQPGDQISLASAPRVVDGVGGVTPFVLPPRGGGMGGGTITESQSETESIRTRKEREAMGLSSVGVARADQTQVQSPSQAGGGGRRMNPPAYNNDRPVHGRTQSNESTATISTVPSAYPDTTVPGTQMGSAISPAQASSAAFPPGLRSERG